MLPSRLQAPGWGVAILALLTLGACSFNLGSNRPEFREVLLQGEGRDKLLLIDISGAITNTPIFVPQLGIIPGMTSRVRQELEIAFEDPNIRGVLLRIDSPGGTLTDSDIIYHSLVEFKRSKKIKILASLGGIAASGALYIAMAADEIYAHPTTITGSIGVILPHMDYTGIMDKLGIRFDPVKSGKFKDIDSPYRKRNPQELKMLQSLIDHQHEKFVKVIRSGRRKMSEKQVVSMADGRIISAQDAQEKGLIDQIGYLDDALKRLAHLTGFPSHRLVRYANPWRTGNNIYTNAFPIEVKSKK